MNIDERSLIELPDNWYVSELPNFGRLLWPENGLPLVLSFLAFRFLSWCMSKWAWTGFQGFRQYRLCNLTVCVIHSTIVGGSVFYFALTHLQVMLNNPATYYEPSMKTVFQITVGYFIHDTIHMMNHEISKWTIELFLHHSATIILFLCPITSHQFAVFAYWALLMEVNSIFLHLRTIHQLSGRTTSHPGEFEVIKYTNVVTFIIFRFMVQTFQINFTYKYQDHFVYFYKFVGLYGSLLFLIINIFLFYRVLASDGFLGKKIQERAKKTNRDHQKNQ
ncbi:unnamed protein product [Bursaphelenchus okinawaensis]|uniref:TLC domain-containing protein n=1 Tax=Bursaphelenchus okinawaensis TaxID=465554 RepID=A0A811KZ76_9BILA|nr:unnamed protein product [Bursaphelenchus okinawaensis]CAG9114965.1 unnamed protein product [Bursaphelenchus okinawaensis]